MVRMNFFHCSTKPNTEMSRFNDWPPWAHFDSLNWAFMINRDFLMWISILVKQFCTFNRDFTLNRDSLNRDFTVGSAHLYKLQWTCQFVGSIGLGLNCVKKRIHFVTLLFFFPFKSLHFRSNWLRNCFLEMKRKWRIFSRLQILGWIESWPKKKINFSVTLYSHMMNYHPPPPSKSTHSQ